MGDVDVSLLANQQTVTGLAVDDWVWTQDISAAVDKKMTEMDHFAALARLYSNASTARVISSAGSSDTYLSGSNIPIPSGYPLAKTRYRCKFDITKTAAGTATPIISVRFGTAGTTSDTARCTFTFGAGTAAADSGEFEVDVSFRTVGSSTSAVLAGVCRLTSNLTTTGISNATKAIIVVSSGFDSTVSSSIIGVSYNGGTSAVHTCERVVADLIL